MSIQMKQFTYISFVTVLMAMCSPAVFAQNDPLGGKDSIILENDRIEDVIESNKPIVKPPYQEIEQAGREDFQFNSQEFYVETDFEPAPPIIKPWPKEKPEPLRNNTMALGIGRFLTPYGRLSLHNGRASNVDLGLDFTHLSAHRDAIPLRRFRRDYGTVSLTSIQDEYNIGASAYVFNTSYFTFADTIFRSDEVAREDSLRRRYTRGKIGAFFETNYDPDAQYEANAQADVRFLFGNGGNSETNFDLSPNGAYFITPEFKVGLQSDITISTGNLDTLDQSRVFLEATPFLAYDNGTVRIKGGVRYNLFRNSIDTSSVSNFGGIVELSAGLVPDQFSIIAGYRTGMQNYTYYDLLHENPYLKRGVIIRPTVEKMNIYLGGKGNIGGTVDYSVRLFYKRLENQMMYFAREFEYQFDVVYDSLMTNLGTQVEVNFSPEDFLDVGGTLNLNIYNTSTQEKYYHATPLRLDLYGIYRWEDQVSAKAEMNVFGPRAMSIDPGGTLIRLGPFIGINLSGDYRITEGFSVFLKVNNLLGSNYQRWHNYQERRLDFLAGIEVAF